MISETERKQNIGTALGMIITNIAHGKAHPCNDCKGRGVDEDHYPCHCRADMPFTTEEIKGIAFDII